MNNNELFQKERFIDEPAIREAAQKLITRFVARIDDCLNLPNVSNLIWETEDVGSAPACLREVELRLDTAKKGYELVALPVLYKGETVKVEPYYIVLCRGNMGTIRKKLLRQDMADELTRQFIVLAKLSMHEYPHQKFWKHLKDKLLQLVNELIEDYGIYDP